MIPRMAFRIVEDTITPTLAEAPERIGEGVAMELDRAGAEIVDYARSIVPVRTGFLRDSIYYRVEGMELEVGAEAPYASYVEFGTRRMAPRPYLRPAIEANRAKLGDGIMAAVLNALEGR